MMLVFSTVDARPSPESMKFPVFSLLAGNFGFRDGFAQPSKEARDAEFAEQIAREADLESRAAGRSRRPLCRPQS
jgi:hypothetical protein